jgi:hypothetical protein
MTEPPAGARRPSHARRTAPPPLLNPIAHTATRDWAPWRARRRAYATFTTVRYPRIFIDHLPFSSRRIESRGPHSIVLCTRTSLTCIPPSPLLSCSRRRFLLLRLGPPDEAAASANDAQSHSQLWPVQENGGLCTDSRVTPTIPILDMSASIFTHTPLSGIVAFASDRTRPTTKK